MARKKSWGLGDADIFLYQAYTASPSLRLLPSIVS